MDRSSFVLVARNRSSSSSASAQIRTRAAPRNFESAVIRVPAGAFAGSYPGCFRGFSHSPTEREETSGLASRDFSVSNSVVASRREKSIDSTGSRCSFDSNSRFESRRARRTNRAAINKSIGFFGRSLARARTGAIIRLAPNKTASPSPPPPPLVSQICFYLVAGINFLSARGKVRHAPKLSLSRLINFASAGSTVTRNSSRNVDAPPSAGEGRGGGKRGLKGEGSA